LEPFSVVWTEEAGANAIVTVDSVSNKSTIRVFWADLYG